MKFISNEKTIFVFGSKTAVNAVYIMAGEDFMATAPKIVKQLPNTILICFSPVDWNSEFTPWPMEALFKKQGDFSGNGEQTRDWLLSELKPQVEQHYPIQNSMILGYSLGGLFSLWMAYQTDAFSGFASCSGSLWYRDFVKYMKEHSIQGKSRIYLSLGDTEEKAKNQIMAAVGDRTRQAEQILKQDPSVQETILQWNQGGHFNDVTERMKDGLIWLLKQ